MTLKEFFDMPIDTQKQAIEWLRIYQKWYFAKAKKKKNKRDWVIYDNRL